MFDSVFVDCPHCTLRNELQTKQGECKLGKYNLINAPPEVLLGVEGRHTCEGQIFDTEKRKHVEIGCGNDFSVKVQCITKAWTEARIEAEAEEW